MIVPNRVVEIVRELYNRNTSLARGNDNQRRALTTIDAEQIAFELGNRWGTKKASEGRPPSKDSIAYQEDNGTLWNWDWQNGSTREPNGPGEMENITGQVFIPVEPINHLGVTSPSEPPTPIPIPIPINNNEVLNEIKDIKSILEVIRNESDARDAAFLKLFDELKNLKYVGTNRFLGRIEFKAEQ